jgi:hypothetical protein
MNDYLASRVAARKGSDHFNQELHDKLMNQTNWYLPLK